MPSVSRPTRFGDRATNCGLFGFLRFDQREDIADLPKPIRHAGCHGRRQAWDKGLVGTTLRYPYEVRDSSVYFDDIPDVQLPKEMLMLAEHIFESKRADFDPSAFVDRYEEALTDMLKKKQAGMPAAESPAPARPGNVVNLFEALKKSLEAEAKKPAAVKKPKKAVAGQREMLLPTSGKGPAKEASEGKSVKAAKPAASNTRRKAG